MQQQLTITIDEISAAVAGGVPLPMPTRRSGTNLRDMSNETLVDFALVAAETLDDDAAALVAELADRLQLATDAVVA